MYKSFTPIYFLFSLSVVGFLGTSLSETGSVKVIEPDVLQRADTTQQRIKDVLFNAVEIVDTVRSLRNVAGRIVIRGRELKTEKVEETSFDVITTVTTKRTDTLLIPASQPQFPAPVLGARVDVKVPLLGGVSSMPFIPFVFFNENSASIPERYLGTGIQKVSDEWDGPNYFVRLQHGVLWQLGEVMQRYPDYTVALVGCNSDYGLERGNKELSLRRAQGVQSFLREHFKIDKDRITVEARNLPYYAWDSRNENGAAFNQRVELRINSADPSKKLVVTEKHATSEYSTNSNVLVFKPQVSAGALPTFWELKVMQADATLKAFAGTTEIPQQLEWTIGNAAASETASGLDLSYQLNVRNNKGERAVFIDTILGVNQVVSVFLIPFYDASTASVPSGMDSLLSTIQSTTKPASTIRITGYSTPLANEPLSKAVALQRANNVRAALHLDGKSGGPRKGRVIVEESPVPNPLATADERLIYNSVRVVVYTARED